MEIFVKYLKITVKEINLSTDRHNLLLSQKTYAQNNHRQLLCGWGVGPVFTDVVLQARKNETEVQ